MLKVQFQHLALVIFGIIVMARKHTLMEPCLRETAIQPDAIVDAIKLMKARQM